MKFITLTTLASAFAWLGAALAPAQGTESLLTTVGTTVQEDGTHHAYILWQPGEAGTTLGKRFSINRKAGAPDDPAPFTRVGIQTLQSSPSTIRALLELGAVIDVSHETLPPRIDGLYREITFRGDEPPAAPAVPNLDAAGKLAYLIAAAATEAETLSRLFFLGRAHPGVMMSLGHAFHIPVSAGVHTFEIREIDLADEDIRVVGRVTVDTANPVALGAPASPVRVFHPADPDSVYSVSAKDHLNARFRWGVPGSLRERLPHTFGFDLFRVRKDVAESLGWHLTPPSPELMVQAVRNEAPTDPNPDFSRVNDLPILVNGLLTPAEAGDPSDTERIYYADDGIWHRGINGEPVRREYEDGEAFYYFAAARAITGRPGQLSPGTLAVMCRRLPPRAPVVESVDAEFVPPATEAEWEAEGQGGTQFLEVKIRQLPDAPAAASAQGYFIYRWSNPSEYLNNLGNPVVGQVGYVAHVPGEKFVTFQDNGAGAPTPDTHEDVSVWYTARAVGISACPEEILGGHSGPVPGFLRDFEAPAAPGGDFEICRNIPSAFFTRRMTEDPEGAGLPRDYQGIGIDVRRLSPHITAADIDVRMRLPDRTFQPLYSRRHLFQHGDSLRVNLPYAEPELSSGVELRISVRGVTAHGLVSGPAEAVSPVPQSDPGHYGVFPFQLSSERQCLFISSVPEPRPMHEAFGVDGSTNAVSGFITFLGGQGVSEWRVYRRVGAEGPLTLIAKAEGPELVSPAPWLDESLPAANGARVCYYAQTFDQNANPSPLFPIGCVEMLNPDLPTPMLSAPVVSDDNDPERMRVTLGWFCDPVGVERFEIFIARQGGGIPDPVGISPLLASEAVVIDADGLEDPAFYRFQSSRVSGPLMGNGPQFTSTFTLPADEIYHFAVAAVGPGEYDERAAGSASNVVSAIWEVEPTGPQAVIPWPQRGLGRSYDPRLTIETYTAQEGPFWPVALPAEYRKPTSILIGVTRHPVSSGPFGDTAVLNSPLPPEEYLFQVRRSRRLASTVEDLMPFILYRYQLPSDLYPDARANIVQCTPLIDRMAWRVVVNEENERAYQVRDPFFNFFESRLVSQINVPVAGGWTDESPPTLGPPFSASPTPRYLEGATGLIFLNDPLPVAQGAKYRHLIVQFDDRGEIRRVIPIEPIQH